MYLLIGTILIQKPQLQKSDCSIHFEEPRKVPNIQCSIPKIRLWSLYLFWVVFASWCHRIVLWWLCKYLCVYFLLGTHSWYSSSPGRNMFKHDVSSLPKQQAPIVPCWQSQALDGNLTRHVRWSRFPTLVGRVETYPNLSKKTKQNITERFDFQNKTWWKHEPISLSFPFELSHVSASNLSWNNETMVMTAHLEIALMVLP